MGGVVVRPAHAGRTGRARFEKQLQKFLTMIVWRLVGMNLHCKCFFDFFFLNNTFSSPDYAAFYNSFFLLCSVHVAQISIALGTMLYLISRKICLTERKKCGLASLLF